MSNQLKDEAMGLFRRGLYDQALATFEEAAASYEADGDSLEQGEMLNNVGVIHRVQRGWDDASAAFRQAEALFAAAGDRNRQAQVLGNLGDLYAAQGKKEEAAHYYSDAAELMAQTGDTEKQAQLLRALSLLRLRQRRVLEALVLMDQSLSVRPQLNFLQRLFRALLGFAMRLVGGK